MILACTWLLRQLESGDFSKSFLLQFSVGLLVYRGRFPLPQCIYSFIYISRELMDSHLIQEVIILCYHLFWCPTGPDLLSGSPIKQVPETFPHNPIILWEHLLAGSCRSPPCPGPRGSHFSKKSWFLSVVPFFMMKEKSAQVKSLCENPSC